jgi:hypothetical protein
MSKAGAVFSVDLDGATLVLGAQISPCDLGRRHFLERRPGLAHEYVLQIKQVFVVQLHDRSFDHARNSHGLRASVGAPLRLLSLHGPPVRRRQKNF